MMAGNSLWKYSDNSEQKRMKVLVGYECSGMVASAFRAKGHEAWSCDILPYEGKAAWESKADGEKFHLHDDVWNHLPGDWELLILHPPCTYLTISGNWAFDSKHNGRNKPGGALFGDLRIQAREEALANFSELWNLPNPQICIENPVGVVPKRLGLKPAQYVQPYEFGDDASKRTGLWLKNLPALQPLPPEQQVEPRLWCSECRKSGSGEAMRECSEAGHKLFKRWGNQGDDKVGTFESPTGSHGAKRQAERSVTWSGIALAMADQWG